MAAHSAPAPALAWRDPRAIAAVVAGLASAAAGRVKAATLAGYRFIPAAGCAGMISAGIGMHWGAWAGLIAGGAFAGIADYRMP